MSIAVVGCGGFIGSHLVERMLAEGFSVSGWDLQSDRIAHLLDLPGMHFFQRDYSTEMEVIAANHSVVILLAALCNPSQYNTIDEQVIQSNFCNPSRLAEVCARHGSHLLYFSTSEVYGKTLPGSEELPLSESDSAMVLGPVAARRWSYACAKQLMERYLVALGHGSTLKWTVVRPFNFIGPHMDFLPGVDGEGVPRVLACFMDAWLSQRPMLLVDGGRNQRAFTWIGDAVDAMMRILSRLPHVQGQCLNLGNPTNEITIAGLAHLIQKQCADICPDLPVPACQDIRALDFYGPGYEDSDRRLPDISKARSILGWEPQVGLIEALRRTMSWYISHYRKVP